MEVAMVFDTSGIPIYWYLPEDATMTSIPDSTELWKILWNNRADIGGVAHTHPFPIKAIPSPEDITTFSAIELALGKRMVWPIVTLSDVAYFERGHGSALDYTATPSPKCKLSTGDIEVLRNLSLDDF